MTAKILFIIFLIAFIILFVMVASAVIAILFHIYGEDPAHQNSVNAPRGTITSTRITRTKK